VLLRVISWFISLTLRVTHPAPEYNNADAWCALVAGFIRKMHAGNRRQNVGVQVWDR
jgi:hypothetical protein